MNVSWLFSQYKMKPWDFSPSTECCKAATESDTLVHSVPLQSERHRHVRDFRELEDSTMWAVWLVNIIQIILVVQGSLPSPEVFGQWKQPPAGLVGSVLLVFEMDPKQDCWLFIAQLCLGVPSVGPVKLSITKFDTYRSTKNVKNCLDKSPWT